MSGAVIGIGVVSIVIVIVLAMIFAPDTVDYIFSEPKYVPDVRFYDSPDFAETTIKKNTSTNVMVMARNFEEGQVNNIEVHTTVIEGSNWEQHLQFPTVTKLGSIDTERGITSPPKYIEITAKDVSGIKPKFKLQFELFADGVTTENIVTKEFTLTE